jgi:hypothetical protein
MRFMIIVRASKDSEAGKLPSPELLAAMGKYNEELVKAGVMQAGVMQAGEGLQASSNGARVKFSGAHPTVTQGPFPLDSVIAGFWIFTVKSKEEAIEWVKRAPNPMPDGGEIEIRQLFAPEDFGENLTPELKEQEDRLRAQTASRQ